MRKVLAAHWSFILPHGYWLLSVVTYDTTPHHADPLRVYQIRTP